MWVILKAYGGAGGVQVFPVQASVEQHCPGYSQIPKIPLAAIQKLLAGVCAAAHSALNCHAQAEAVRQALGGSC